MPKLEPRSEVTELLDAWSEGESDAFECLMPLITGELRRVAANFMKHERAGHTLQPTALVNEVYLRLAGRRRVSWRDRRQFFAFAARTMRRVLVDHARRRHAASRGGHAVKVAFDEALEVPATNPALDLVELDSALDRLAALNERQARVVELRYFAGLTLEETAEALAVTSMTVKRDWRMARLWLRHELVAS